MNNPNAMTFGILIFPGAHGDKELTRVLEEKYGRSVKTIWNHETDLKGIDVLFIPGGFPCKGSSSSSKCIKDSPVIDSMIDFVDRGKILIGIGNGFRVLCETGLVPGTVRMNKNQRFICRNTFIKPDNNYTAVTNKLSKDTAYQIPIATGYGRYTAKEETLVQMRHQEQILFRYCDENASISEEINITGAVDNIAGICNEKKNVFGMIPQPERAVFSFGRNTDGKAIFDSIMEH
ncbi:MAG: phosphoribosylformylglycinamidine synthase I, partial [Bacteroidales bacterium]|nr:phosphoribosylformylglycinamidine synthase I [Bacteroidales bacterium]